MTDHQARVKRFHTTNPAEDQAYFNYIKSLEKYDEDFEPNLGSKQASEEQIQKFKFDMARVRDLLSGNMSEEDSTSLKEELVAEVARIREMDVD